MSKPPVLSDEARAAALAKAAEARRVRAELKQRLKQAEKYGRMIDPDLLVEGREHVAAMSCHACGKLPTSPKYIKSCTSCNAIICKWCQISADAEIDDCVFDKDLNMQQG